MASSEPRALPFGAFFGHATVSLTARGFSLSEMAPTVPEAEVVRHTHGEAHFVLVTGGAYITSARGAPTLCDPPALVYNPPGTTHRDRFLDLAGGRFLTISVSRAALEEASLALRLPEPSTLLGPDDAAFARRLTLLRASPARGTPFGRVEPATDGAATLTVESLCLELLARTVRSTASEKRAPPGWLLRAGELLHDSCREDLSIAAPFGFRRRGAVFFVAAPR